MLRNNRPFNNLNNGAMVNQINWLKEIVTSQAKDDEPFNSPFLAAWFSDFPILDSVDALGVWCAGGPL